MSSCSSFKVQLPSAISNFTVIGNLTPSQSYKWCLKDKFGNRLYGTAMTDGAGTIIISDISLSNLLRSFSGSFILTVAKTGNEVNDQFTICGGVTYSEIIISMYEWTGTPPVAVIGQCT